MHLAAAGITHVTSLTHAVAASCPKGVVDCTDSQGPGIFLRSFVGLAVVALIAGAWFVLRGYSAGDKRDDSSR